MNNGASFEGFTNNTPVGGANAWDMHGNQSEAGATFEPHVQAVPAEKVDPVTTEKAMEAATVTPEAISAESVSESAVVSEGAPAVSAAENAPVEVSNETVAESPAAPMSFEEQFAKIVPDSVGNKAFVAAEEVKADMDMPKEVAERSVFESGSESVSGQAEEKGEKLDTAQIEMSLKVIESEFANIRAAIDKYKGENSEDQKFEGE